MQEAVDKALNTIFTIINTRNIMCIYKHQLETYVIFCEYTNTTELHIVMVCVVEDLFF